MIWLLSTWRPNRKSADILAHFVPLSELSVYISFVPESIEAACLESKSSAFLVSGILNFKVYPLQSVAADPINCKLRIATRSFIGTVQLIDDLRQFVSDNLKLSGKCQRLAAKSSCLLQIDCPENGKGKPRN